MKVKVHTITAEYVWRATAERTADGLMWHLLEFVGEG